MATNSPVIVGKLWVSVQAGAFSGAVQNLGNSPLVGFVADTIENPPAEGAGGFAIYSQPIPFALGATQELWVRSTADVGCVILA